MDVLLSICIPTYNRADIVYECVQSCLKIGVDWLDVVVTDNCSTDNTRERLSEIKDKRFKYFRNEENIGLVNLMWSLTKGDGKYCLLLSDEDEICDVDFDNLKNTLTSNENIGVFQFHYMDESGNTIVKGPEKILQANTFEVYDYCRLYFSNAGGTIIRRADMEEVWEEIYKPDLLWFLYNQSVVPFYCVKKSNLARLPYIKARYSQRNNTGTLNVKDWSYNKKEPYWSIYSRKQQAYDWIDIIANIKIDDKCEQKLMYSTRNYCIHQVYSYFDYMLDRERLKTPLFYLRQDIIDRDQRKCFKDWYIILKDIRDSLNEKIDSYLRGRRNRNIWFKFGIKEMRIYYNSLFKIIIRCIINKKI